MLLMFWNEDCISAAKKRLPDNSVDLMICDPPFGVNTSKKYVSSHYHILYYAKKGGKWTFNTFAFFSDSELGANGGKANYQDREDVWFINREYQLGQIKNKNQLPTALLQKIIMYSSNEHDMVCDFFLGSFSTAKVAVGLGRRACGFELNKAAFDYQINGIEKINSGEMLAALNKPLENRLKNRGKKLTHEESARILKDFSNMMDNGATKKAAIEKVGEKYGRGYWSVLNLVKANEMQNDQQVDIFSGVT